MSSDDGYILRKRSNGDYVLHHYFASGDSYPDINSATNHVYKSAEEVLMSINGLESEYGLTVQLHVEPVHLAHSVDGMPMCIPMSQFDQVMLENSTNDHRLVTCDNCRRILAQLNLF
jgi:hypothetical protein